MKFRSFVLVMLVVCLGGGLAWWLWPSPVPEPTPRASAAGIGSPKPARSPASSGMVAQLRSAHSLVEPPLAAVVKGGETAMPEHPPGIRIGAELPNGAALVAAEVKRRPSTFDRSGARLGITLDPNTLVVKPAYAIYEFDLDKIAQGDGLETALDYGFGYDIKSSGVVVGDAEVRTDENGNTRISSIGVKSPASTEMAAQALRQLATLDQVRNGSYEVRFLRLRSMIEAIWLKADVGGNDLIVPVLPGPYSVEAGLEAGKIYPVNEFLAIFRPYVQQLLQYSAAQKAVDASRPAPPQGDN